MQAVEGKELSEYIKGVIDAVKEGTRGTGYAIDGEISLELAVVNAKKSKDGIKILVVDSKGRRGKGAVSTIKLSLRVDESVSGVLMPSD
ncbi:hypothetical protein [Nitrososphaera sp.]|uniref:hypothetical protein n=1 Tax=Nitrososphaera sp. TaxID=1971748 RepID=UPI003174BFB2